MRESVRAWAALQSPTFSRIDPARDNCREAPAAVRDPGRASVRANCQVTGQGLESNRDVQAAGSDRDVQAAAIDQVDREMVTDRASAIGQGLGNCPAIDRHGSRIEQVETSGVGNAHETSTTICDNIPYAGTFGVIMETGLGGGGLAPIAGLRGRRLRVGFRGAGVSRLTMTTAITSTTREIQSITVISRTRQPKSTRNRLRTSSPASPKLIRRLEIG